MRDECIGLLNDSPGLESGALQWTPNGKIIFQKAGQGTCIFKNIFERYHACILREIASRDESEMKGHLFRIIELKGHFTRYIKSKETSWGSESKE
jgi:hypothetical protein